MADWLILAGLLVITLSAWSLDGRAANDAMMAQLEAFEADDRREAVVEPDAVRQLDPVALGRLQHMASDDPKLWAVARLVAEGALHRSSAVYGEPRRWRTRGPLPKGLDVYERELLDAARGRDGCYLWDLPDSDHLQADAETRLLGEGYLRQPGQPVPGVQRRRGRWSTAAAAAALGAAAVLALDHAWIRAGLALVMGLVSLAVASDSGVRSPTLPDVTARGELALQLARRHYAELNPRKRPASKTYDPATVRMAVALFGWPVVRRIDERIWDDWHEPNRDTDGAGEGAF